MHNIKACTIQKEEAETNGFADDMLKLKEEMSYLNACGLMNVVQAGEMRSGSMSTASEDSLPSVTSLLPTLCDNLWNTGCFCG